MKFAGVIAAIVYYVPAHLARESEAGGGRNYATGTATCDAARCGE